MSAARRMFLLQYGGERVPKSLSVHEGAHFPIWVPIIGLVVETAIGWVVLETGMSPGALADPAVQDGYAEASAQVGIDVDALPAGHLVPIPPAGRPWTWGRGDPPFETALAEVGLTVSDITLAAISHLHVDHTGGLPSLAAACVPVAVQRRELDAGRREPENLVGARYAPDWLAPPIDWVELDGDAQIAPGIDALFTPGHTLGHMSYRITLEQSGTWLFAIDAADLGENLYDRVPPGSCDAPFETGRDSIERLLAEARETGARLVPGHDQLLWTALAHPPEGWR